MRVYLFLSSLLFIFIDTLILGSPIEQLDDYLTTEELDRLFSSDNEINHDDNYDDKQDVQIARLTTERTPNKVDNGSVDLQYSFSAFGNNFKLKLRKNNMIIAPNLQIIKRSGENGNIVEGIGSQGSDCHYIHQDEHSTAAISMCGEGHHAFTGFITTKDDTFEIFPVPSDVKSKRGGNRENRAMDLKKRSGSREDRMMKFPPKEKRGRDSRVLDLDKLENEKATSRDISNRRSKDLRINRLMVKRAELPPKTDDNFVVIESSGNDELTPDFYNNPPSGLPEDESYQPPKQKRSRPTKIVETAVFFDKTAYNRFAPYFGYSDEKIRDLIITYMNGVQAVFSLPSLSTKFEFVLIRIEILKDQPFNHHGGDRSPLLKSFCMYQKGLNTAKNGEDGHWDVALLISGLDFYAISGGKRSTATMGLAGVNAICSSSYNCVIGEFGVTNDRGKPYPSAGFTSIYIMAHEIGHNMGLHHDGYKGNKCDRNGFIMSASRGTKGETVWSSCSSLNLEKLMSEKKSDCLDNMSSSTRVAELNTKPGTIWGPDQQCQLMLLDRTAKMYHTDSDKMDMCYTLKCKAGSADGWYRAGPALEGTTCGDGKWCTSGACVPNPNGNSVQSNSWSDWSEGSTCQSGCLQRSKGCQVKHRECTGYGCPGQSYKTELCDDSKICSSRVDSTTYASEQCGLIGNYVEGIKSIGAQTRHMEQNVRMACSIYCRKVENNVEKWYTPRIDIINMAHLSAYFPDGTHCHTDDSGNEYYCVNKECIMEGSRNARSTEVHLNINQNAVADSNDELPEQVKQYFELDENKNPLATSLPKEVEVDDDVTLD